MTGCKSDAAGTVNFISICTVITHIGIFILLNKKTWKRDEKG
jgi:hypothetical protein